MTADGEPVEVKCLLHSYSEAAWAAGIPERYALQVQHQMLVTGASRCLFGALVPAFGKVTVVEDPYAVVVNAEPIWEWVPRDEHAIRRIIYRGSKFWQQVESGEEPASCGTPHDRAALSARVDLAGEPVELSGPEVADALADYHREEARLAELRECVRHTEREQGKALDRLASLMGSAPAGITPGGVRVEWRETHRKSYTVQASTSRSLRIVTPKEK